MFQAARNSRRETGRSCSPRCESSVPAAREPLCERVHLPQKLVSRVGGMPERQFTVARDPLGIRCLDLGEKIVIQRRNSPAVECEQFLVGRQQRQDGIGQTMDIMSDPRERRPE